MEFDHELNWCWWTFGFRWRRGHYDASELIIGLGPLMLIWRGNDAA